MSNVLEDAARIRDPIEHSGAWLGALAGAALGVIAGVALVVFFPVLAPTLLVGLGLVAGMGVMGSSALEYIAKRWCRFLDWTRDIVEGSPTVFVGAPDRNAARTLDKLECHPGMDIISGARTIVIEGQLAARVKDETRCDGKIKEGCPTVKYGGPTGRVANKRFSGELDPTLYLVREAADIFSLIVTGRVLVTGWSKLSTAYRIIDSAGLAFAAIDKTLGYTTIALEQTGNYDAARRIQENVTDTLLYRGIGWTVGGAGVGRNIHEGVTSRAPAPAPAPAQPPQLLLEGPKPMLALPPPPPGGSGGGSGNGGP